MAAQLAMLAHQGGWDEILLVAGPIVVVIGLLGVVKRRVDDGVDDGVDDAVAADRDAGAPGPDDA